MRSSTGFMESCILLRQEENIEVREGGRGIVSEEMRGEDVRLETVVTRGKKGRERT